jgi:hypothetical protein
LVTNLVVLVVKNDSTTTVHVRVAEVEAVSVPILIPEVVVSVRLKVLLAEAEDTVPILLVRHLVVVDIERQEIRVVRNVREVNDLQMIVRQDHVNDLMIN